MKRKYFPLLICTILAAIIFSSCHECSIAHCNGAPVIFYLKGFTAAELDTVYRVRYIPGKNFTQALDTTIPFLFDSATPYLRGSDYAEEIDLYTDDEIIIPGVKTIHLSDFILSQRQQKLCGDEEHVPIPFYCQLVSLKVDGVTIQPRDSAGMQYVTITK